MGVLDYILLAMVATWVIIAVVRLIRRRSRGGCCGCMCNSCTGNSCTGNGCTGNSCAGCTPESKKRGKKSAARSPADCTAYTGSCAGCDSCHEHRAD